MARFVSGEGDNDACGPLPIGLGGVKRNPDTSGVRDRLRPNASLRKRAATLCAEVNASE